MCFVFQVVALEHVDLIALERMREIQGSSIREYTVKPDHVVHPETTPLQVLLLLHHGANNIPVVSSDNGKLTGMISAREVLAALQDGGSA